MVGSVHEATLVLGFNSIRSMALSAALMLAFPHSASGLFDRRTYWLRSFRVACYTQALAKCLGQNQEAAFTVGMFYDIGQLVLDVCIPEQFERMLAQQKDSGLSLIEIEQSELGFDHALIGAEMARHWNFPAEIEHAIYYWRTPEREPFEWNVGMVHVAVLLETGLRGEELIGQIPATLCHRMRLTWEGIQAGIPERNHLDEEAKLILEA